MARGDTTYSEKIHGDRGNYGWAVLFDVTDGYVGITQYEDGAAKSRVLLSPAQVRALLAFMGPKRAAHSRTPR